MRSPVNDWDGYFAAVDSKPLHPFLRSLTGQVSGSGLAYDLGCGTGQGSVWLAEQGYEVIAVDQQPAALARLRHRIPDGAPITTLEADISSMPIRPCHSVLCAFTLFFLSPSQLEQTWSRIRESLLPGGYFIGQVLGENDQWVSEGYSAVLPDRWTSLLQGFEPVVTEEIERDGADILGSPKHWHITHFCLKRV